MLKKLVIFLTLTSALVASVINWEVDYEMAKTKAQKEGKPLFVMVSHPTCPECNYMKKKIFTQDKIHNYINKNYISVKFQHKSAEIPKDMQMWGIPRIYFSRGDDKVYAKYFGGAKADKLYGILETNLEKFKE